MKTVEELEKEQEQYTCYNMKWWELAEQIKDLLIAKALGK